MNYNTDRETDIDRDTAAKLRRLKGMDAARWISALDSVEREGSSASDVFLSRWPGSLSKDGVIKYQKTAIGAAPSTWGSTLTTPAELAAGLLDVARPLSVLGRFAALARPAPLNVALPTTATAAATFAWVGGGRPAPLSSAAFDRARLLPGQIAGLLVVTDELIRLAAPGSDALLADHLARGLAEFSDRSFTDPAQVGNAGDPFVPASVTAAAVPILSTGDPHEDLRTALREYRAQGGNTSTAAILLSSADAAALALRSGAGGAPQFPGLTVTGGTLAGLPAFASDAVGDQVIVMDAARLLVADPNTIDVRVTRQADVEMNDEPDSNTGSPAMTSMVSLFQTDSVGVLITRYLSWDYSGAIAVVEGVNYLSDGGSPL